MVAALPIRIRQYFRWPLGSGVCGRAPRSAGRQISTSDNPVLWMPVQRRTALPSRNARGKFKYSRNMFPEARDIGSWERTRLAMERSATCRPSDGASGGRILEPSSDSPPQTPLALKFLPGQDGGDQGAAEDTFPKLLLGPSATMPGKSGTRRPRHFRWTEASPRPIRPVSGGRSCRGGRG